VRLDYERCDADKHNVLRVARSSPWLHSLTSPAEMTLPSETNSQSFRIGRKCPNSKDFGAERLKSVDF